MAISAFRAWKPPPVQEVVDESIEEVQEAVKLSNTLICIKRLFAFFKSKQSYPYILKNKVVLLFGKKKNYKKDHLYTIVEYYFGKSVFTNKPDWDNLWAVFRRKMIKDGRVIEVVPARDLFIRERNIIKLNPKYW
jgi:hypothetical protein